MDIYTAVPMVCTGKLTFRLVEMADAPSLFRVYSDPAAVALMNDDNCDFGFYVESPEKMEENLSYWRKHYEWRSFVRFAITGTVAGCVIGTVEGFAGEEGVLRIDIASAYEREDLLTEVLTFARRNFGMFFDNARLVTKAIPEAKARRSALMAAGWQEIGLFRGKYPHYFAIDLDR